MTERLTRDYPLGTDLGFDLELGEEFVATTSGKNLSVDTLTDEMRNAGFQIRTVRGAIRPDTGHRQEDIYAIIMKKPSSSSK